MAKYKLHTLVIDKIIPGGLGLGRLKNGLVVLVPFVLPGEKVLVRGVKHRKDYLHADLKEILMASPDRIEPPCPIYGRCGGCDLQHAGAQAQLHLKKTMFVESITRDSASIFKDLPLPLEAVQAAPAHFNYRQRIRVQVDAQGQFGFFRPGSHEIVPTTKCLLAQKPLNHVLRELCHLESFQELLLHCGVFELLFNPDAGKTILLLHYLRRPRPADTAHAVKIRERITGISDILMPVKNQGLYDPLARTFQPDPVILSHTSRINAVKSEFIFTWEAGGFSQVNIEQNSNLIEIVLEMIAAGPHKRVLDLYCGYGNFSLPAASYAEKVLGIDTQNAAIRRARENAGINRIDTCHFEKNHVLNAVAGLAAASCSFDTIILDPPRRGAPEVIEYLPRLGAKQIIYVSCNPATLARDLVSLTKAGYNLARLVPVDMFPQTHHLESIALLKHSNF